jgi:apolipoprotein N-acyltransferase
LKRAAVLIEPILFVVMFQFAFRWPGLLWGIAEALSAVLLPVLLTRAAWRGLKWWAIWVSFFLGVMLLTSWMPQTISSKGGIPGWLSLVAGVLLWAYDSLPPVLAVVLAKCVWERVPGQRGIAAAAFVAALVMVACESWLLHIYPWTWATPLASPPFLGRSAAILGTEGLSAIVWLHGIAAGCLWASGAKRNAIVATTSAIGILLVLSGVWNLLPRGREMALDVAIVQPNYPVNTRIPNQMADMWHRSDAALARGGFPKSDRPTLLLWPESSITDGNYLLPAAWISEIAKRRNVAWLFGTDGRTGDGLSLNIVIGEATGQKPFVQAKVVPMPFGERMPGPDWIRVPLENIAGFSSWDAGELSAGSSFHVPDQKGGFITVHPLICSESLLPQRARAGLKLAGGDLLTEHTNDGWFEDSIAAGLHASLARLRALETGLPLVRATMSGLSGLVMEDGRWRHFSGAMEEGAWSFELKWRPINAPARTMWPFYSLLLILVCGFCIFVMPRAAKKRYA